MLTFHNMKKIFILVFLIIAVSNLCMADGKKHHGTRVNIGPHVSTVSQFLNLIVSYVNSSSSPITIKEIEIFKPDGTKVSPDFSNSDFPQPPFVLGPFESKIFALAGINNLQREIWPPMTGWFQVHADWESNRATHGLKGSSVVVTVVPLTGVVSNYAIDGFDIKGNKQGEDDSND